MSTPPLTHPPARTAAPAALIALVALAALSAVCVSSPAWAQPAQTIKDAHLRAGPARSYPVISVLWRGTTVMVQGCLQDYSWCDVVHGADRGWVYAANLRFEVGSDLLPVPNYGAEIGIGILGFMLGNYWAEHYRDRPWYGDRHRWVRPPSPPPHKEAPGLAHPGRPGHPEDRPR